MSTGQPYPYDRSIIDMFERPDVSMVAKCHELMAENAQLRAEMKRREEAAYEHGLGDATKVYRENRILAATVAALVDRQHPMGVRP